MSMLHGRLTYTQIIMLSFLCIILFGTVVLCLPISSKSGEWTSFVDAMFTATSATCVTGLVVFDTYLYWSGFGQLIILLLIQIGGLGLMTCIAMIALLLHKKITLGERRLLMQSAGSMQISGIVKLIKRIILCTAICEGLGIIVLSFVFCPKFGFGSGLWCAIFTSISAFCNAGFDLMGRYRPFSSFAGSEFAMNPIVNIMVIFLIVTGGIGFIVWRDIFHHKTHFRDYDLHSKIVLVTTAVLILGGTVLYFIFEYGYTLSGLRFDKKILASLFQSVTPRTAGFNTVDTGAMSDSGSLLTMILMLIGGSPGSTAGGIKTTTFFILVLGALTSARRYGSITVFKRKLGDQVVVQASAILILFTTCVAIATMIISAIEPFGLKEILFECISAINTVGLTLGITPQLSSASQIILMILMYTGRIGGLSLMLILAENRRNAPVTRPTAKIMIG
ncbi:MAG: Trk family potassium uptake protein [Clostridia bacterium]|nr:Trk family potassium uptake protein [Clostridia bacterium]